MFLIDKLKGVFKRMISPKVISDTIKMAPLISSIAFIRTERKHFQP